MPASYVDFVQTCCEALLFFDDQYWQWGLRVFGYEQALARAEDFFASRHSDACKGDLIVGESLGDSGRLLLRCDPAAIDFGAVVSVSALDPRQDWPVAAQGFEQFLSRYALGEGDKYWVVSRHQ